MRFFAVQKPARIADKALCFAGDVQKIWVAEQGFQRGHCLDRLIQCVFNRQAVDALQNTFDRRCEIGKIGGHAGKNREGLSVTVERRRRGLGQSRQFYDQR